MMNKIGKSSNNTLTENNMSNILFKNFFFGNYSASGYSNIFEHGDGETQSFLNFSKKNLLRLSVSAFKNITLNSYNF